MMGTPTSSVGTVSAMGLKIVRGGIRAVKVVQPKHEVIRGAREIGFRCHTCKKTTTATLNWDPTPEERTRLMRQAVDEHRRIGCTEGSSSDGRVYDIWYPGVRGG